jgi:phage terminase small subunit
VAKNRPPAIVMPQRPEPPPELGAEEAEIWRKTVKALRADWFTPETHPMLRNYCRLVTASDRLGDRALRAMTADDDTFVQAVGDYIRAVKVMTVLASKLRLTPLSRQRSGRVEVRDPFGDRPRPWEK